jgi:hypothetical protein
MTSIRDEIRRRRVVRVAAVDGKLSRRRGLRWFLAEFLVVVSGGGGALNRCRRRS